MVELGFRLILAVRARSMIAGRAIVLCLPMRRSVERLHLGRGFVLSGEVALDEVAVPYGDRSPPFGLLLAPPRKTVFRRRRQPLSIYTTAFNPARRRQYQSQSKISLFTPQHDFLSLDEGASKCDAYPLGMTMRRSEPFFEAVIRRVNCLPSGCVQRCKRLKRFPSGSQRG